MKNNSAHARYWRANLKLIFGCLAVWFLVSFGCGILLVEFLNQFQLGGYKLGFWFAQQGSIFSFIALIFFYVWRMNKLDEQFGVAESEVDETGQSGQNSQSGHSHSEEDA